MFNYYYECNLTVEYQCSKNILNMYVLYVITRIKKIWDRVTGTERDYPQWLFWDIPCTWFWCSARPWGFKTCTWELYKLLFICFPSFSSADIFRNVELTWVIWSLNVMHHHRVHNLDSLSIRMSASPHSSETLQRAQVVFCLADASCSAKVIKVITCWNWSLLTAKFVLTEGGLSVRYSRFVSYVSQTLYTWLYSVACCFLVFIRYDQHSAFVLDCLISTTYLSKIALSIFRFSFEMWVEGLWQCAVKHS